MAFLVPTRDPVGGLSFYELDTNGSWNLGDSDEAVVGNAMIEIFFPASTTGTITVCKKIHGSTAIADTAAAACWYEDNNVSATETSATITGTKTIKVYCDGQDVILRLASVSVGVNGAIQVSVRHLRG